MGLRRSPVEQSPNVFALNDGVLGFNFEDLSMLLRAHDPRNLPQIKKGAIAQLPDRPDLVLRYDNPGKRTLPLASVRPRALTVHLRRYEAHLQRLGRLGLPIADRSIYALKKDPYRRGSMVYTVVPRISDGTTLDERLAQGPPYEPAVLDAAARVGTTLLTYYTDPEAGLRPHETPTNEVVWDIEGLNQYAPDGTLYDYNAYLTTRTVDRLACARHVRHCLGVLQLKYEQQQATNE